MAAWFKTAQHVRYKFVYHTVCCSFHVITVASLFSCKKVHVNILKALYLDKSRPEGIQTNENNEIFSILMAIKLIKFLGRIKVSASDVSGKF